MLKQFPEYYRVSRKDLLEKFDDFYIVLDACALLDIFRLKSDLVDKVFDVIEHYKEKFFVTNHAAYEYNRRVNDVLETQMNKIEEARKAFDAFIRSFQAQRNYPYISLPASHLMERLKKQIDKDFIEQKQYLENQLVTGSYQNRMAMLLDGHVLQSFSKEEIADIEKEGEERYSNKIPPGWKDASKDENRYGDLVNWKEILRFAKENDKSILFVSNDVKQDWIVEVRGKKLGVQPLLLKEFYETTGKTSQLFHIYTLESFLQLINEHDKSVVSEETVKDITESIGTQVKVASLSDVMTTLAANIKVPDYMKEFRELQEKLAQMYKPFSAKLVDNDSANNKAKEETDEDQVNDTDKAEIIDYINHKYVADSLNKASLAGSTDEVSKSTGKAECISENYLDDKE